MGCRILSCIVLLLVFPVAPAAADVTIIRDSYGVPHIYGATEAEVAYGVGIAQCEDNFGMVVFGLFAGVGRLSELLGPGYLDQDIEARTLGHAHFAARDWPRLDPRVRAIVQGYCDGINTYARQNPSELPFQFPPVEPVQVIARHRQILLLAAVGIARGDAEASKADGYHPAYNPQQVGDSSHPRVEPGKSNSWALAPGKTAAGRPMLLIDPHWPSEGHLQLYEAHLHGGGLETGGFMINGTPLPGLGFSNHAAWTFTAGGADSSDAFALRINPDNPDQYEMDGRWVNMDVRTETVNVRRSGKLEESKVKVRATLHGPVLTTKGGVPFAAAFAGFDRADAIEQTYAMCTARTGDEFKAAIAMDRLSYFNLMWATREGDIGYVQTGQVPVRAEGFNWEKMVPGWTRRTLYAGTVPFNRLPQVHNPPTGFLQNCNTAANVVTPGLKFTPADFPIGALWGHYGAYRARGQRATDLLAEVDKATLEDGRRIAFDSYVPPADLWVPVILRGYEADAGGVASDPLVRNAVEILRNWDRYATRDSVGATVFRFWRLACEGMQSPVGRDAFVLAETPQLQADALKALRTAANQVKETYGKLEVPWGDIKRLRRGDREWPLSGDGLGRLGMDTLRATAGDTLNAEKKILIAGGQCVTTIVVLTDTPTVHTVVAFGQSNKPASAHFSDQASLYSDEKLRVVPWTRAEVEKQATSTTRHRYK